MKMKQTSTRADQFGQGTHPRPKPMPKALARIWAVQKELKAKANGAAKAAVALTEALTVPTTELVPKTAARQTAVQPGAEGYGAARSNSTVAGAEGSMVVPTAGAEPPVRKHRYGLGHPLWISPENTFEEPEMLPDVESTIFWDSEAEEEVIHHRFHPPKCMNAEESDGGR